MRRREYGFLGALTFLALLINGYHPGAEDSEIYVTGVEKLLHPRLFPVGDVYFELHAHMTLFPQVIAGTVRLGHLPLVWALFLWHVASIFLFLLACRVLAGKLFTDRRAIWGGVALEAALLTLPVAGTALYIMDQYINPRNMTAFAVVFAVVYVLEKKYWRAALFLIFAAAIHPFMTAFAIFYCLVLGWMNASRAVSGSRVAVKSSATVASFALFSSPMTLFSTPKDYRAAAISHSYQYLLQWHWYELLGAVAPLAILWWLRSVARQKNLRNMEVISTSLVFVGVFYCILGVVFSSSTRFESLARLQPMRGFYLLYILLILISGGLFAEYVLKNRPVRWLALFIPLCVGMLIPQLLLFPASDHVEWPGAAPKNPWVQAFLWVQGNTPQNAIFALDPVYMNIKGEDANGFRAIAERSQLADRGKDSGVVEMFPQIADSWLQQVRAQTGLDKFNTEQFKRLRSEYGASWAVLQRPGGAGLDCPYANRVVKVCRLP